MPPRFIVCPRLLADGAPATIAIRLAVLRAALSGTPDALSPTGTF